MNPHDTGSSSSSSQSRRFPLDSVEEEGLGIAAISSSVSFFCQEKDKRYSVAVSLYNWSLYSLFMTVWLSFIPFVQRQEASVSIVSFLMLRYFFPIWVNWLFVISSWTGSSWRHIPNVEIQDLEHLANYRLKQSMLSNAEQRRAAPSLTAAKLVFILRTWNLSHRKLGMIS